MSFFGGFDWVSAAVGAIGGLLSSSILGTKEPKAPAIVPDETKTPQAQDPSVKAAKERRRRIAASASGRQSTILTSSQGLPSVKSTSKTILGRS